ncbi:MAG TPA: polysaccharide deacetylase family protein [Gaiella sp.]|jgi:peptidoglycan/xylan/chitin deacetylase (PgdA/CDA1 family)|nr:polysaccharide deacetylase family protein [Gaiella sp.]
MEAGAKSAVVRGLNFHGIGRPQRTLESGEARYWITIDGFRKVLDLVADRPDIRISFDDGNASDVEIGLEALLERGLVASFFVVAGRVGSRGSLDADGLRELSRQGMTIGTHGMDHRPLRGLSPADRQRELVDAREEIADTIGRPVDEIALPLGLYDRRLLADLKALGYTAVHTSERMPGTADAWLRPRFSIRVDDTVETIEREVLADPSRRAWAWVAVKRRWKRLR